MGAEGELPMKRFLKKDKLLVLLALLALLVSLVPIAGRMQTEENCQ